MDINKASTNGAYLVSVMTAAGIRRDVILNYPIPSVLKDGEKTAVIIIYDFDPNVIEQYFSSKSYWLPFPFENPR